MTGEAPQVLAQVNALLTRVTELQSNLERMVPSTTRILGRPLAEVRRVLRLDAGEGFEIDAARINYKVVYGCWQPKLKGKEQV